MRTPGGGATFRVRLPLEEPHAGDEVGDAEESDGHRENRANGRRVDRPGGRNGDQPDDHPEHVGDDRGETATKVAGDSIGLPKK
jgi:hypothetical protein